MRFQVQPVFMCWSKTKAGLKMHLQIVVFSHLSCTLFNNDLFCPNWKIVFLISIYSMSSGFISFISMETKNIFHIYVIFDFIYFDDRNLIMLLFWPTRIIFYFILFILMKTKTTHLFVFYFIILLILARQFFFLLFHLIYFDF